MAFNTKQLLLCIAVIACGLTALVIADKPYVTSLVRFSTISVLVLVAYGIWTSEGEHRAFRVGFLAWGCVYFLFHVALDLEGLNLGTGSLLSFLLGVFHPTVYVRDSQGMITGIQGTMYDKFLLVGHCLLTLLFGVIGGFVTMHFYRKRQCMLERKR